MSPRFLLDTNTISEPLRASPSKGLMRKLERHEVEIAIAAPVWHELLFGCLRLPRSRRRRAIEAYLQDVVRARFPILPYDAVAAEWHARERARLTTKGSPPPYLDGQIASIARVHELTLVTANVKDYRRFEGVRVENWLAGR